MRDFWKKSASDPQFRVLQPAESAAPREDHGWQSFGEADGRGVRDWVSAEFPAGATMPPDAATRRQFLKLMGASAALAGASGCGDFTQPQEKIVPYVRAPEHIVPGRPLYYATAMTLGSASLGLLIETQMGRPIKVEGNPLHPAVPEIMPAANQAAPPTQLRFGATDAFAQASILSLYDPDRSQTVLRDGQIDTWESMITELRTQMESLAPSGGQGLRLLTEPVVSPTLAAQIGDLLKEFPNAVWHQYEPINDDNNLTGARLAFGEAVSVNYLARPTVAISLDADFMADGPMRLQLAHRTRSQNLAMAQEPLTRLYAVETSATLTGAVADHRLPVGPGGVVGAAIAIAQALGLQLTGVPASAPEVSAQFIDAIVADLRAANGKSLVVAGRQQPAIVHALAHWINNALGNVGQTIEYRDPIVAQPEISVDSLRELVRALEAREVAALIMIGGNPAYNAPGNLKFSEAIRNARFSLHLAEYADETSAQSLWHVPQAHLFESWSDTRAGDGTASIVQPMITPLHEGKTAHELLAAILGNPAAKSHDIVRAHWQQSLSGTPAGASAGSSGSAEQNTQTIGANNPSKVFDATWQTALHDGVIANTAVPIRTPAIAGDFSTRLQSLLATQAASNTKQLYLALRPDYSTWDGRFANNGWLQELPRPFSKLTWDNAALINPRTANEYRVKTGDIISIETAGGQLETPVFVLPSHPQQTITVTLGYGRSRAGRVGNGVGVDVYPVRTTGTMSFAAITRIQKTGGTHELVTTQHHFLLEGRHLVRSGTLEEFEAKPEHPAFVHDVEHHEVENSIYPEWEYGGNKWGMVINQSACIGCNACVAACQSENNIPVVGKDQVSRGREMHWLRIDNYYSGDGEQPSVYQQPMLCMHCENAPCEPVCPVAATSHSVEGLNEMTYNRCVGTRYCSNNCPYKVRRFNFFDYNAELRQDAVLQLLPNPDVTVRSRGVMEKCTYCVQRINGARMAADKENRPIRDGEVITACQAACPTSVITFGNLNDPNSAVRRMADSGLNYTLLADLNTRARTSYLGIVRNPNSALEQAE